VTKDPRVPGILHVYGQDSWHGALNIMGDEKGLRALARAVRIALECGAGNAGAMQNDGEGFWIEAIKITEAEAAALPNAYTADYARAQEGVDFPESIHARLERLTADGARAAEAAEMREGSKPTGGDAS
jgi:hypothetical protein